MADTSLNFILRAIWKGEGVQQGAKDLQNMGTKGTSAGHTIAGSFTELNSVLSLARQGFNTLKGAYDSVISSTMTYGLQVKDLARITGDSVESTSMLIQAADDARISYETLTMASRMMVRQGIQPSIQSISDLADKYNTLSDPLEKNRLLMETFGRAGLQMGKLLERGSEGIKASADQASELGLVLSKETVQASQELFEATDNLEDAMKGLSTTIGVALIPSIVKFLTFIGPAPSIIRSTTAAIKELDDAGIHAERGMVQLADGTWVTRAAFLEMSDAMIEAKREVDGVVQSIAPLTEEEIDLAREAEAAADALLREAAAAREAGRAFGTVDENIENTIESALNLATFMAAGGGGLTAVANEAQRAFEAGEINLGEWRGLMEEIQVRALNLKMEAGLISFDEAAQQAEQLGLSMETPSKTVKQIRDHLDAIKSKTVDITINQHTIFSNETQLPHEQGVGGMGGFAHGGTPGPGVYEVGERGTEGLIVGRGGVEVVEHGRWLAMRGGQRVPGLGTGGTLQESTFERSISGGSAPRKTSIESKDFGGEGVSAAEVFGGGGGGAASIQQVVEQITASIPAEVAAAISPQAAAASQQVEAVVNQQRADMARLVAKTDETNALLTRIEGAILTRSSDTGVAEALQKADFR